MAWISDKILRVTRCYGKQPAGTDERLQSLGFQDCPARLRQWCTAMARRRRSRKRTSCSNFVFSDVWNMCLLEYKQYGEKCNTRKMHTVSVEVSGRKLRIRYHVHNLPRSHCELPKEVEVFCHQQILDLNQCMVSLANLGPPSQLYSWQEAAHVYQAKGWQLCFLPPPIYEEGQGGTFQAAYARLGAGGDEGGAGPQKARPRAVQALWLTWGPGRPPDDQHARQEVGFLQFSLLFLTCLRGEWEASAPSGVPSSVSAPSLSPLSRPSFLQKCPGRLPRWCAAWRGWARR